MIIMDGCFFQERTQDMHYEVYPRGVCSTQLDFDLDQNTGSVSNIQFHGGCNGGLKTIAMLVDSWTIDQIAEKFIGVRCGAKTTSCPDQLAKEVQKAWADLKGEGE